MKSCVTAILTLAFSFSVAAQSDSNAPAPSLAPPRPQAAPAMGTLFMTPDERAQIGKAPPLPPSPVVVAPVGRSAPVEAPPAPRSVLNGFVKRSDGIATIWVDGREKTGLDEALLEKITPESVGGSEKTLRVTVGGETTLPLQAVNRHKGKVKRAVVAKPLTILRPKKAKPRRK